jgi:hypothetical protein
VYPQGADLPILSRNNFVVRNKDSAVDQAKKRVDWALLRGAWLATIAKRHDAAKTSASRAGDRTRATRHTNSGLTSTSNEALPGSSSSLNGALDGRGLGLDRQWHRRKQ